MLLVLMPCILCAVEHFAAAPPPVSSPARAVLLQEIDEDELAALKADAGMYECTNAKCKYALERVD